MTMTDPMDNQFDESNLYLDDPETEYACSVRRKSTGFNQLQKLIMYHHKVNQYDNIMKLIKERPELINQQNTNGWSALMIACRNSNRYNLVDIIKLLLAHPVTDIRLCTTDKLNALMLSGFHIFDLDSDIETFKLLLNHPMIDINSHDDTRWTILMKMITLKNNDVDNITKFDVNIRMVKLLLANDKIDVNLRQIDGWTALMIASRYSNIGQNIQIVKLLLDHPKIDVNMQSNDGYSSLMLAACDSNGESNIQTVKALLDHPKINVNLQNTHGNTALMIANRPELKIAFRLIINLNASLNLVDKHNNTVYTMTKDTYLKSIIKYQLAKSIDHTHTTGQECTICIDDSVDDYVQLSCGHYFHFYCIDEWLYTNRTCPVCRHVMY